MCRNMPQAAHRLGGETVGSTIRQTAATMGTSSVGTSENARDRESAQTAHGAKFPSAGDGTAAAAASA